MSLRPLVFIVTAAAIALASAPARAQMAPPSQTPPPAVQPAPQNEDWNNVSHINGTPVPVGERNSYLRRFRRFNISSNPIGWIAGFYGLSASYALNNHVAIRGDVNIYNIIDSDEKGNEIGVGVPLYLRRTYQGAFLEPGFIARTWDDGYCDAYYSSDDCDADVTFGPQMLFGWHWTWESGFNLAMAAGAGRNLDAEDGEYYDQEELFFNGYFRVGYAF